MQLPLEGNDLNVRKVLYSATGKRLKACRVMTDTHVIRDKLIYLTCRNPEEAAYLVAILNAPALCECFSLSEGYFGLLPLRNVPIMEFDPANVLHQNLVDLTGRAENNAWQHFLLEQNENVIPLQDDIHHQIRERYRLNIEKVGIFHEIDEIVIQLFPDLVR